MSILDNMIYRIANNRRSHFWLFFTILLLLSLLMMYFYQPLCPGQDFFFHYRRLQALMDNLDSPFLIYLDYTAIEGYGYFTKAFYPDFVLIPFAIVGNFTNASVAYQLLIFTMTVLCGVFTYKTVNTIYRNAFAASISAILYTFAVYRLLDIYHRAAIGEAISFTFVPIVILGLYHIIRGDYRKWYIIAIGFSLMLFTHLISSVLMFITVLILIVIHCKRLINEPKRFLYLLLAGGCTLLITAYYIFPMLEQMASDTFYYQSRQLMSSAADSGLELHWLIWGLFTGIVVTQQAFIPGIGVLLTCIVLVRLFVQGKSEKLKSADIGIIIGIVYLFAASAFFPWNIFPFSMLNFIQMGWRLFEFTSFFFAVAGGYYLSLLITTNKRILVCGFIICLSTVFVLVNDSRTYEMYRCGRPITQEASFITDYHLGGLEYIPEKVPSIEYLHNRGERFDSDNAETTVTNLLRNRGIISFVVETDKSDMLELPLIYYKGYEAELNDNKIQVLQSENGLVQIPVDKPGNVKVYYAGTDIQKVSFCISLLSIIGLCIYIVFHYRKRRVGGSA